jgi:hypothetical protein
MKKYMLLIQYGDTTLPGSPEWEALSERGPSDGG